MLWHGPECNQHGQIYGVTTRRIPSYQPLPESGVMATDRALCTNRTVPSLVCGSPCGSLPGESTITLVFKCQRAQFAVSISFSTWSSSIGEKNLAIDFVDTRYFEIPGCRLISERGLSDPSSATSTEQSQCTYTVRVHLWDYLPSKPRVVVVFLIDCSLHPAVPLVRDS